MRALYLLSFTSLIILLGCIQEENYEYPIVQTGNVVEITSAGLVFHGKIMNEGNAKILDHGFVWHTTSEPLVDGDNYVKSLGKLASAIFSAEVNSAFIAGQTYYLRAYVNDGSQIIYGRTVTFKSLGSSVPTITGFSPETATWGDTLTIEGENFSWKKDENIVEFGKFTSEVIVVKDTQLIVLVPEELDTTDVMIRLYLLNHLITSQEKFNLIPPKISSVSPEKGTYGDIVTIVGKYFSEGKTQVFFNGIEASISSLSDTEIVTIVPKGLEEGSIELKVVVAHQKVVYEDGFISTAPRIIATAPQEGTWNDIVSIEGVNFSTEASKNIVRFGNVEAEVIDANEHVLKVKVPVDLLAQESRISVEVKEQINEFSEAFILDVPKINVFSPEIATFRDVIAISGQNFNPKVSNNRVYFGETEAEVIDVSDSEISVIVPDEYYSESGKAQIRVAIGELSTTSLSEFNLLLHEVLNFTPTSADRNDEITLDGNYFNPTSEFNRIFLDEVELNVISASENQIIVSIPEGIEHGNHSLKVSIAGRTVTATNPITIYEPWQRLGDFPGSRRSGAISFAIGNYGYVGGGMYNYNSLRDFYKYDPGLDSWTRLSDLPFLTDKHTFTSNNDNAYVLSKNEFWKYNSSTDTWVELSQFPGASIYSSWPHILFSLNDKIYVSSGLIIQYLKNNYEQIWEYNTSTDAWTQKTRFPDPVNYCFGLVVNDIGYRTSGEFFYKYDQANDLWTKSSKLQMSTATYPAAFSINGKGYTATGGWADYSHWKIKDVYEYNMLNGSYLKLVDFPNNSRTQTSYFVIGNKAYIGLGLGAYSSFFNDFWEFDPSKIKR